MTGHIMQKATDGTAVLKVGSDTVLSVDPFKKNIWIVITNWAKSVIFTHTRNDSIQVSNDHLTACLWISDAK